MTRLLSTLLLSALAGWTIAHAQDVVPAHHRQAEVASCPRCATGACGTCGECVRIADLKKKQVPVYSCRIKEICVPNCCNVLGRLFGWSGDCKKVEVRQLVKKYRTEEECVSKCATHAEAAKHYEAQAKRAAEAPRSVPPAGISAPRPTSFLAVESAGPVSFGPIAPTAENRMPAE